MYCLYSNRSHVVISIFSPIHSILINCDNENLEIKEYPKLELAGGNAVTAMTCIEGRATESGDLIVLLACWNQTMYIATPSKVVNLHVEDKLFGRIQKMTLSPNQQFVACHTSEGWVVVLNSAFNKKVRYSPQFPFIDF